MYRPVIFLITSGLWAILAMTQPVEIYSFKDDCSKRDGSSSYISTCNYDLTRDYYLDMDGKLTDNGLRYLNAMNASDDGLVNGHSQKNLTFKFRYGEVRWRARMLPVECRDGRHTLEIRPLDNGRWHTPIIGLMTCPIYKSDENNTLVATTDPRSCYGKNSLSWTCGLIPCLEYPGPGVLDGVHNYTLRWTADEMTWLIDNAAVFHLTEVAEIPHSMMVLAVSDLDTVPYRGYLNMIVESVSVWQDPVDASVRSADQAKGPLPNGGHGLQNKATLVKVYSLLEQCTESNEYGRDTSICYSIPEYIQDICRQGNATMTKDVTDAEVVREIRKNEAEQFSFSFQYGEVRWRAQAFLGIRNVLNIEGPPKQPRTDSNNSVSWSVMLLVQPQKSVDKYVNTVWAARLGYRLPNNTDEWTCAVCPLHSVNLWHQMHNYTLRWTPDELVWLIDEVELYQLTDKRKIPRHPMMLKFYELVYSPLEGHAAAMNMPTELVTVWQNWTSLIQPDLVGHFYDDFASSSLNALSWNVMHGPIDGLLVFDLYSCEYDSELVSVKNRTLRFEVGQSNKRLYFGRVDGLTKYGLLYPGEAEWRMRFHYVRGFLSVLRVQQNKCHHLGKELGHDCFSRSIPAFGFVCDEWGKVKTTLNLTVLQFVLGEFDIKIPIDRQRKRYDGLREEETLEDFHIYRIVWTSEYISWYIDGHEIDRVDLYNTGYRLSEDIEPLSVSLGTCYNENTTSGLDGRYVNVPNITRYLLMEIDYVVLRRQSDVRLRTGTPWLASHTTTTIIITCMLLAVCGTVFAVVFCNRRRRNRSRLIASDHPTDGALLHLNSLTPAPRLAALLTRYMRLLEVPENSIEIPEWNSPTTILGEGSYGIVLLGVVKSLPVIQRGSTIVAVKMQTDDESVEAQKAFSEEVKIMVKAAGHVNVVNILGVVAQGRPSIILEYCKFGSLQSFLKNHLPNAVYVHVNIAVGTLLPFDDCLMKNQWLLVDEQNRNRDVDLSSISKEMLCTGDLIQFSSQISRGMEYLGARCIIHRDLAARNVLVNERRILKISDFGLARYAEQVYTMVNPNVRLPFLWMSPDALITKTFSSKSDVWSFGVLLHEIFTLGEEPFSGPNVVRFPVSAFAHWLKQGNQMDRPTGSPIAMYQVMRNCWNLDCEDRPTFSQLRKTLDALALVAVKSDHYTGLVDDIPKTDEISDCNERVCSELDDLQRMIGECCAETADNDDAVAESAVSWNWVKNAKQMLV